MILGITGGFGCGKSTASRCFEKRGFRRIDSDALVRENVLTAPDVMAALRAHYGECVFDGEGRVNRAALAEKIFSDDSERVWLEELTHPMVFHLWRQALGAEPGLNWAVESPLLFEKDLENWFDFTVCIACAPEQQLVRLQQRGLSRELAERRISKQLSLARKIERAGFVLWNDGPAEFLQVQVDRLADSLATAVPRSPSGS